MATLTNFMGAESNGLEEVYATSGTVAATSSNPKTGTYCYSVSGASSYLEMQICPPQCHIPMPGGQVVGFAYRGATITSHVICTVRDPTASVIYLLANSNGSLTVQDANAATVFTTAAGVLANDGTNWNNIDLFFEHSASGDVELFVDRESVGSSSAEDFLANTGTFVTYVRFAGVSISTTYYDDMYFVTGAASSADALCGLEVRPYRSNLASATPDVGDALTTGTWAAIQTVPFSATVAATYDGTLSGVVYTDDVGGSSGGGPYTDTNITGTIVGVKGTFRAERGNGGATAHGLIISNSGIGSDYIEIPVDLNTTPANFSIVKQNLGWAPTGWEWLANQSVTQNCDHGLSWNDDGSKLYAGVAYTGGSYTILRMREYTPSTNWDATTITAGSYVEKTFTNPGTGGAGGLCMSIDGNYVYGAYTDQAVANYALSTPFDLSTASTTHSTSFDIGGSAVNRTLSGPFDSNTRLVAGNSEHNLIQETMSTAHDLSTTTKNYDASWSYPWSSTNGCVVCQFTPDGNYAVVFGGSQYNGDEHYVATASLSTAWDLSSTITGKCYQRIAGSWSSTGALGNKAGVFRQYAEGKRMHWVESSVPPGGGVPSAFHVFEQMAPPQPDSSEYCAVGLQMDGARDLEVYGMLATVAHVPPAPPVSLVYNPVYRLIPHLVR